ncbi:hypothetical protein JCM17844_14840 [Iodidimonas gelatinilytica]|uniref:Peptidase M23 n=1 Tax=Iodidimonas gelatinilytica TaxID=1236966 RepID=A0A5A7MVJ8_9PROT|nr:hypothetical protein [Iodidimonas gelatinilytica]GEQ97847.1 hypothetical protein JCM17844_14840 [Iodidimonas gelatinilytica]GER00031.1 hypothetical protein JCM17845_06540 [Iodidimonas gelatinilytica]
MKHRLIYPCAVLPFIAWGSTAFAHDGAHMHPHGIDLLWILVGAGICAFLAAAGYKRMRK